MVAMACSLGSRLVALPQGWSCWGELEFDESQGVILISLMGCWLLRATGPGSENAVSACSVFDRLYGPHRKALASASSPVC